MKYFWQYRVSHILAMMRNNRRDPAVCDEDFQGKVVVISGATSGIGYHTARKYASRGAHLVCINRSPEKSAALKTELEMEFGIPCECLIADLSRRAEVYAVGETLLALSRPIDVMIHNAGIFLTKRQLTEDSIEKVLAVHFISSFILNNLLLEKFRQQRRGRILFVNSEGHRFAPWGLRLDDLNWERRHYTGLKSYGSAKLAQLLSLLILDEKLKGTGVTINAMHPGAVKSNAGGENGRFYRWWKRKILDPSLRPTAISAEALYYLGVSPEMEGVSGKFFNLTREEIPAPPAWDRKAAQQLWERALAISGWEEAL